MAKKVAPKRERRASNNTPPTIIGWCSKCFAQLEPQCVAAGKKPTGVVVTTFKFYCSTCARYYTEQEVHASHAFVSPWVPMSVPCDIKHVGKAIEETGELVTAIARCLIQGIDEVEPTTKKPNRQWLEEEIADVLANAKLLTEYFGLDKDAMAKRRDEKIKRLSAWHGMLKEQHK